MTAPAGRRRPFLFAALALAALGGTGAVLAVRASRPPVPETEPLRFDPSAATETVRGYAALLDAMYSDTFDLAVALKARVDEFVSGPTSERFEACKAAWKRARPYYIQTEVARFYEGPIDLVEGAINAWPVDESFIDYVAGNPGAGIVNDPVRFPTLDEQTLRKANEEGGETDIATGWHAIEFLLWGQDAVLGPGGGRRSYLDFVDAGGTAPNPAHRREYLRLVAAMLVSDLDSVRRQWSPATSFNYPSWLLGGDPRAAVSRIMSGVATLAFGELRGERLVVPFTTKDREDEHSCFSDTTHLDHLNDMIGIRNVWEGRYKSSDGRHDYSGPGLKRFAAAADPRLAEEIGTLIDGCIRALEDPRLEPFETAVLGNDSAPGRAAIQAAVDRLADFTTAFVTLASRLDVRINSVLKKK